MLVQVVSLNQVRTVYVRLGAVNLVYLLCQVRSCYVWLCQGISG